MGESEGSETAAATQFEAPKQSVEKPWLFPENSRQVNERVVTDENGKRLGEIHEFAMTAEKGAQRATFVMTLPGVPENSVVSLNGWHTWSESGEGAFGFRDTGTQSVNEATQGKERDKIVTPGNGKEALPIGVGEGFGYVDFRQTVKGIGTKSTFVGLVPGLTNLEDIRFRKDGEGNMVVTLEKNLENSTDSDPREISFNVFVSDASYGDALTGYGLELAKLVGDIKPATDQVGAFTWADYGKFVTQQNVEAEINAISSDPELHHQVGMMIVDDGWQKEVGNWDPKLKSFPDMKGLTQSIQEKGLEAGIWVAPFITDAAAPVFREHPDWIVKDEKGQPMPVSGKMVDPSGRFLNPLRTTYGLDISMSEVRQYLISEIKKLNEMGFEVFKLDYLSAAFTGGMRDKDKTSVEYYRGFFNELRDQVPGIKKIIGCGAPILESTGLFEMTRYTGDSADATFRGFLDKMKQVFAGGRADVMYGGSARTAFHRLLAFGQANGLMLDGIHIGDPKIDVSQKLKDALQNAFPAMRNLGLTNLTIGDSLVRSGETGRKAWTTFLEYFKRGVTIPRSVLNSGSGQI